MGREGTKTVANTSVNDIYDKILDAFLAKEQKKSQLTGKRKSKAQIVEDAILLAVALKDNLEEALKAQGVSDEEAKQTVQRLKAEYGISPKA